MIYLMTRVAFLALLLLSSTRARAPEPSAFLLADPSVANRTPQPSQGFAATSVPVYVSDFELFAAPSPPPAKASSPTSEKKAGTASGTKDSPAAVLQDEDAPSIQARRLMDFLSTSLVESLKKSGYTASRRIATSTSTGNGVLLRGVFAESDYQNRIRRAILGAGAPGAKFFLYVGTFNLSRPDQPLYQVAPVQSPDNRYGPVITLNSYIPLVKYELLKNPAEDDVRKMCDEIVRNLTTLLNSNPAAFSQ